MKTKELLNQKEYFDFNIHERITIKSWWGSMGNLLSLVSRGGYYFNGFFVTSGKYIQARYTMTVKPKY